MAPGLKVSFMGEDMLERSQDVAGVALRVGGEGRGERQVHRDAGTEQRSSRIRESVSCSPEETHQAHVS